MGQHNRLWGRSAALALGALVLVGAQSTRAARIEVEVTGVEEARGHVRVSICTQDTFLQLTCPYEGAAEAKPGVTVVTVADVPPGIYAAQVFHDDTDSGMIHQGLLGIPREAIGFSNNAPLHTSGPHFKEAAFSVRDGAVRITLKLRRLFGGHARRPRTLALGN